MRKLNSCRDDLRKRSPSNGICEAKIKIWKKVIDFGVLSVLTDISSLAIC